MNKSGNNVELGKRIRFVREEVLGLRSQEEFADFIGNVTRGAVGNWEQGKGIKMDNLRLISTKAGVSFDWLANATGDPPRIIRFGDKELPTGSATFGRARGSPVTVITGGGPVLERHTDTLPVYAAAQGGKGHLIITLDPVDYRAPPAEVLRSKGAHGILVVGDSMIPAYEPGDIAWVTPHRPMQPNKDVILYHQQPTGEDEAMIKRLLNFNQTELRLRQYNPPMDFTESRADWPICHQIHSKTNA
jgi:phage repressor protein C with HTH and peptisase S24 domain